MEIRTIFLGYKTHDHPNVDDEEDGSLEKIRTLYILDVITEVWDGRTRTNDNRPTYQREGEAISYKIWDKFIIEKFIEKKYHDIYVLSPLEGHYKNFVDLIVKTEKAQTRKERNKRRRLNALEIDHD